jgi:hypothetical protein
VTDTAQESLVTIPQGQATGGKGGHFVELIRANVLANFAYYRRSRLLIAFLLISLLLTALQCLPALFTDSGVQAFNTLQGIFSTLNLYLLLLAGCLGLFIISSNLRSRSLKMVFTKPCPPSVWLASAFVSAVAISLLLNLTVLGGAVVLSFCWHLPIRAGLVFISVDTFLASVGIIAYLTLLASLVHPAIAVTFAVIFNAGAFYDMQLWTRSTIHSGNSSVSLRILDRLFYYLYILLPMFHAFEKRTEGIYSSMRVLHGEWKYLLYSFGYVLALSAFCYLVALSALQRKRYI